MLLPLYIVIAVPPSSLSHSRYMPHALCASHPIVTYVSFFFYFAPQDLIAHGPGMVFHVINLVVMVLTPMVVIHVKDSGFSLGKCYFTYRFVGEFFVYV